MEKITISSLLKNVFTLKLIRVVVLLSVFISFSSVCLGETLSNRAIFSGQIDYALAGSSFRDMPNAAVTTPPDLGERDQNASLATSASSVLTIPAGSTVVAAYLYWGHGNGTTDDTVTFQDPSGTFNTLIADQIYSAPFDASVTYFGYFKDVTALVNTQGSGTYTMSDLDIENSGSTDASNNCIGCSPWYEFSTVGGTWALYVVYEDTANV